MANVPQATREDIEALDRGVVEAGQIAAQALARVEALERGLELALSAARPPDGPPRRGRHLHLVHSA